MFKRVALAIAFVILVVALACLYVGGVASLSNRVAHLLQVGPKLAPSGTTAVDEWLPYAETEHFRYYVRLGDHIPRWAMELAEDHLKAACAALQVQLLSVIEYYKHPSQADLYQVTGSASTGIVVTAGDNQHQELHSVSSYDPHEVMHALAHATIGEPPAFFDEGLATAFGWDWTPGEKDVHQRASLLLDEGRLVSLERLLTNWDFRSYKSYPAYTIAGSFSKYLLAEYGAEKLSTLLALDKYSQRQEIEECFATTYGKSIYKVEADWRAALRQGTIGVAASGPPSQSSNIQLVATGIILFAATLLGAVLFIVAGEKVVDAAMRRVRPVAQKVAKLFGWRARE